MICRSCVARMLVLPMPNRPVDASATATILKVVNASFNGTVTLAWPLASSWIAGCHSNKVSSSSRVCALPPPPPAGTAFLP